VLGRVGGLVLSDASTTVKGIVELATDAETITGTDPARAVTPAGLAAGLLGIIERIHATGTAAERAATTSTYWQFWQDTDNGGHLYIGDKAGGWRLYSGQETVAAGSWQTASSPFWGRTVSITLDTVLEDNEVIMMTTTSVSSGFGSISPTTLTRNLTETVVSVRHTQMASGTTNPFTAVWHIVQT